MSKTSEEVANLEREVERLRDSCSNIAKLHDNLSQQNMQMRVELAKLRAPANERMRAMQSKIDKQSDRIAALEAELVALRELGKAAQRYAYPKRYATGVAR